MKRIYYVTNMFPSKKDNYGIFCKKTYDFLQDSEDFEITKMTAIRGKSQNRYYNIIRYAFMLLSIAKTLFFSLNRFDVIYIQYVWKHAFFISRFINRLLQNKKSIVINFHGEDLTEYGKLSEKEKVQFYELCKVSSAIVVPSVYFRQLLLDTVKLESENKIIVTPSGGIDSDKFFVENKNNKNGPIVYCSRFDKDKGWDDFILAAEKILEIKPDIDFIMIGYGKETELVKKLVDKKKLNEKIKIIVNPKQTEIAEIYSESRLFVFPTRRMAESLGLVALEAMSCGLPVISSNIGAISEYIIPGQNGFLYKPGDVGELTDEINDYLNLDNKVKEQMKMKALEMAEKYKDKNVVDEFILNLRNLL